MVTIRPADDKGKGGKPAISVQGDTAGEVLAGEMAPARIEHHDAGTRRDGRQERGGFLRHAVLGAAGGGFGDLDHVARAEAQGPAGGTDAVDIAGHELTLGAGFQPADTGEDEAHVV